ncbi:MAG TPA: Gfo/Idh/MocA family oxidoreductase [Polyangiaceae bacterium]|nr:Gfo/Idh/MocA family oxidoreductase [Polyangiaceae bacterium]
MPGRLRVAIAGMGFIGPVHLRAARRAGADIAGISGGGEASALAAARAAHVDRVYESSEALVTDPAVDVVHLCVPNHLHAPLARLALESGKHVICEKPLATTAAAAADLALLAARRGRVAAVPFVYRFHAVVREARARLARGQSGPVHLIHGSYLQDWLATPGDTNWRVDPARGGESRAFADIGSHWCDLVEFVSGHRIARVSARTLKVFAERAAGDAEAFGRAPGEGRRAPAGGEDAVTMAFETDRGAAGSLVVSQVSQGRKNRLWFEIDAAHEALAFDQEDPERLWVGSREGQQTVLRDPARLSPEAARYATLPAGHAQGYGDAFDAFVADAYAAVRGEAPEGLPTFDDGLRAARVTEAVLASARSGAWQEVGA